MSHLIHLFRTETRQRYDALNQSDFFETDNNLEPFSAEQFRELKERLLRYDYSLTQTTENEFRFTHPDCNVDVLLTKKGLYFSAGFNEDSIFEAGMTASEFTDTGEFEKYDPQNDEWETY